MTKDTPDEEPLKLFVVVETDRETGEWKTLSLHTTRDGADSEVQNLNDDNKGLGIEDEYDQEILELPVKP